MARTIFEIAKAFQNKVEEDTNYMFRFGENFRSDFMGNFEMPEKMSRSRYNDLNNRYLRDDLAQNYDTNLATSRNNAEIARDTSIYSRDRLPQDFELRDRQRDLGIIQTENAIQEQRNNQIFEQFKQEVGAQAPVDGYGMANYFRTLYQRNDQAGGNANITARINEEFRSALGPALQSLESVYNQMQQLQTMESMLTSPDMLARSGMTAEQVRARLDVARTMLSQSVNSIAQYKDALEIGAARGLVRPDFLVYLDPNYLAQSTNGSITPTGLSPYGIPGEVTPQSGGLLTDVAQGYTTSTPVPQAPSGASDTAAQVVMQPPQPVVQTAIPAEVTPTEDTQAAQPTVVPDEVWDQLMNSIPGATYESLIAAGIAPATAGVSMEPKPVTTQSRIQDLQTKAPSPQHAEVFESINEMNRSDAQKEQIVNNLELEENSLENITNKSLAYAEIAREFEGNPEKQEIADNAARLATELEGKAITHAQLVAQRQARSRAETVKRVFPEEVISLIEYEPVSESDKNSVIEDLTFIKDTFRGAIRNLDNIAMFRRSEPFTLELVGQEVTIDPEELGDMTIEDALKEMVGIIDARLSSLQQ